MKLDLTSFYESSERLEYHPSSLMMKKRTGIKRLIAFDDRFERVKKELEKLITQNANLPVKILDIGIGDGVYEFSLNEEIKAKCEFFGVDISEKQMARVRKLLKESKVVDLNLQKLPYQANSFDIVIVSEILEHVFYPEKILQEAQRVLKINGFIILTFPNSSCLQLRLGLLFKGSSPLLNYPENKEHIRFFSSSNIQSLLDNSVKLVNKIGVGSFLFDKWNFISKIPMPRLIQVVGNKFFPSLALGNILILQKND